MMNQKFDLLAEMRRLMDAAETQVYIRPSVFLTKAMEPFLRTNGMQPIKEGEWLFWGIAPPSFGYVAGAKIYTSP
ncbi:MAG: hypothetical protein IPK64_19675 [bacterium]|nr:hypothetical protein [bacterium]